MNVALLLGLGLVAVGVTSSRRGRPVAAEEGASFPSSPVDDGPCPNGGFCPQTAERLSRVSSPFGPRKFQGSAECHRGIDFPRAAGTPVRAVAPGVVEAAGEAGSAGNRVTVLHAQLQATTTYMHLSEIHVAVGQAVRAGDILGLVGSTGRSTGPHLHFELRDLATGSTVDPAPFLGLPEGEPC